jgi:hypothetical protein
VQKRFENPIIILRACRNHAAGAKECFACIRRLVALVFILALFILPRPCLAQSSMFNYQGRITESGIPANGSYDLTFSLFSNPNTSIAIAGPVTRTATAVSNGMFFVALDFGSAAFDGSGRWLQIGIKTNGSIRATSAATASVADTAESVPASSIAGTLALSQMPAGVLTSTPNLAAWAALNPAAKQDASENLNYWASLRTNSVVTGEPSGGGIAVVAPLFLVNPGNTFAGSGAGLTGPSAASINPVIRCTSPRTAMMPPPATATVVSPRSAMRSRPCRTVTHSSSTVPITSLAPGSRWRATVARSG